MRRALLIALALLVVIPNLCLSSITIHVDFGSESLIGTDITNAPEDSLLPEGSYNGWCVDYYTTIWVPKDYQANIYWSYDPELPHPINTLDWPRINYILNHKLNGKYSIQDAIWYFSNPGYSPAGGFNVYSQQMIDDALAYGGNYRPGRDGIGVYIIDSLTMVPPVSSLPPPYQLTIVEGDPPVPEPGVLILFGSGLVGIAGVSRKRLFRRKPSSML